MNFLRKNILLTSVVKSKLTAVRKSANARGYTCTLTLANVRKLLSETHCAYTGVKFGSPQEISFERVDNTRGYEPGNVIAVTQRANWLKANFQLEALKYRARTYHTRNSAKISHWQSVIQNTEEKIARREQVIAEQLAFLKRDKETLAKNLEHQAKVEAIVAADIKDGKIFADIVRVIEDTPNIGTKYMTTWQKLCALSNTIRARVVKLTNSDISVTKTVES